MKTLDEAKQHLRSHWEDGTSCPACGQFVKLYKRKITSSMAYGLILMTQRYDAYQEFHLEEFFKNQYGLPSSIRGDITKLKYWNFLIPVERESDKGAKKSGIYMLSNDAYQFVKKQSSVPMYALLYNNKFRGFDGNEVFISECLGNKFDYFELMAA